MNKKVILIIIATLFMVMVSSATAMDTKYDSGSYDTKSTYLDTFYGGNQFTGFIQGTDRLGRVRTIVVDPKKAEEIKPPQQIVVPKPMPQTAN